MCFYQIAEKSGRFDLFQKIAETVCFPKGRRQSSSRWRDRVGEARCARYAARRLKRRKPHAGPP